MLDFLGNLSSVLISVVIVGGFLAIAAVVVFEIGAMFVFWIKGSLRGSAGSEGAIAARPPPPRRFPQRPTRYSSNTKAPL
jgi:hypothetical protein